MLMEMVGLMKAYETTGHMEWGPANNRVRVPVNWGLPVEDLVALTDKVNRVRSHATENEPIASGRGKYGEGPPV